MIDINNLTIEFDKGPVVDGISFSVGEGEIVGIVGESGSGKSMTAYAIMDLLPPGAKITSGYVSREVLDIKDIAMVYQEPANALNPVMKVGKQIENAVKVHFPDIRDKKKLRSLTEDFMENAGLKDCSSLYSYYPHELSGGMRQRILIAMALACKPKLIIADEPTTALDPGTRIRIIERFRKINQKYGTAVLLISHDIDVISSICKRILVMKDGRLVESGPTEKIMSKPVDEYTKRLVASAEAKKRGGEKYSVPDGKGFGLSLRNVTGYYDNGKVKVLDNVSLDIYPGEFFGIVGESGSGKSTIARAIAGLLRKSEGSIKLNGEEINNISYKKRRVYSKDIQIIFQDPFTSLNPKMKIGRFLEEPLRIHHVCSNKAEMKEKVINTLSLVELDSDIYDRYPSELSGGQRQRISIAAALILNPGLIIADEPVSAVDLTVEAQILELLKELHKKFNVTFLFISHDFDVVKNVCDRIAVIEKGKIISIGEPEKIL